MGASSSRPRQVEREQALRRQTYADPHTHPQYGYYPAGASMQPQSHGNAQQGGHMNERRNNEMDRPNQNNGVNHSRQQTSTVVNHVNLKKHSLHAFEEDGLLRVRFTFDASSPCAISVFFSAYEEARSAGGTIRTTASSNAVFRHHYPAGLGHTFTLPMSEGVCPENIVRSEGVHPLVIRLEAVPHTPSSSNSSSAAGQQNNDVDAMNDGNVPSATVTEALPEPPGCALPRWVQAQTTYAGLHKSSNSDEWEATVSCQTIAVDGKTYHLQDIYGIEDAAGTVGGTPLPGETTTGEPEGGRECVICMAEPRNTTVLPCRHLCMCTDCAKEMRKESNRCPICREQITSLLTIKVNRTHRPSSSASRPQQQTTTTDADVPSNELQQANS